MAATAFDILSYGAALGNLGRVNPDPNQNSRLIAKFRLFFLIGPNAMLQLYNALDSIPNFHPTIHNLLLVCHFLKEYPTETAMATRFNMTERTWRNIFWKYIDMMFIVADQTIVYTERHNTTFVASVDGVHFRIKEPRQDPGSKWYSHKFNKPGLSYEIALSIHDQEVLHVHGPFPAAEPDNNIFNSPGGLGSKVSAGKKIFADATYTSCVGCVTRKNPCEAEVVAHLRKRALSRQESYNSRIKVAKVLSCVFRCSKDTMEKHNKIFRSVCLLVQYDMQNGYPLFDV